MDGLQNPALMREARHRSAHMIYAHGHEIRVGKPVAASAAGGNRDRRQDRQVLLGEADLLQLERQ